MSIAVVDANVGVKWFVPEVFSTEARQWRSGPDELHTLACFFDIVAARGLLGFGADIFYFTTR